MSEEELFAKIVKNFPELEVTKELGRGAEGVVYYATNLSDQKECALKVLTKSDEDAIQRFVKEGRLLKGFDHPNVVTVFECGRRGEMYFHKMEYCAYESLLYRIAEEGLDDLSGGDLMVKIALAVHYVHEQKVLHRDLKPENIMMTGDDEPKVVDFGLAYCAGEDLSRLNSLGSAGYAAPEIWSAPERLSIQSDVYALGAILYTILTKVLPDAHNVNYNHLFETDKAYIPVILKAMAASASKRYCSAKAFADAVQDVVDRHGEPPQIW